MKDKNAGKKVFSKSFGKKFSSFLEEKKYTKHFLLCDDNTHVSCLPVLLSEIPEMAAASVIKIYDGEEHKNIYAVEYVWEKLTGENADRNAVLINLGGGMVCDLGGFAAATFKRGIDFIHVPTTLLSMADAAVGGKQGIDFMNYKNQIGVFKMPAAIFIHESFLLTLPEEQLKSGFAEIIKHALLAGGKFWKEILELPSLKEINWVNIIEQSLAAKAAVVEKDPYEKSIRKVLNFGHTIGHAIESFQLSKNQNTHHGFCIAAGMMGELYLSSLLCGLSLKKRDQALAVIKNIFPPPAIAADDFEQILDFMKHDKKNSGGKIQFVLLEGIGEPRIECPVNEIMIMESLRFISSSYS
ncbi:MAG: 3-dehydroquinate synthase [Chitinophagales bacterium]